MNKPIKSALISVFYKDGLEIIVKKLQQLGVTIYSTGGTSAIYREAGALLVFPWNHSPPTLPSLAVGLRRCIL